MRWAFNVVGYGCTTCIGNSGPLPEAIAKAVEEGDLNVASVLSGNRNFEGRINSHVKSNYLASPPLVVAYAIAGSMRVDLTSDPLGKDEKGRDVYLKDLWSSAAEIAGTINESLTPEMFTERYADLFKGPSAWRAIGGNEVAHEDGEGSTHEVDDLYHWQGGSTYVRKPPFFEGIGKEPAPLEDIRRAYTLAILGDSVTTDHISPAGAIAQNSPAGEYLKARQIEPLNFNSYGSRRGNDQVMTRGTFANIRLRNEMLDGVEGGYTKHIPSGEKMTIYDAAMRYQADGQPLVVIAGTQYGTGSSRDWAAKGTRLLGVRAVIAQSFERIHRSNLIGMGVLPLQFMNNLTRTNLNLEGDENYTITGISEGLAPRKELMMTITFADGHERKVNLLCRIDTADELKYYRHGGILHYVLRQLVS